MKQFIINEQQLSKLLNHISNYPLREVYALFNELNQLPELKKEDNNNDGRA